MGSVLWLSQGLGGRNGVLATPVSGGDLERTVGEKVVSEVIRGF